MINIWKMVDGEFHVCRDFFVYGYIPYGCSCSFFSAHEHCNHRRGNSCPIDGVIIHKIPVEIEHIEVFETIARRLKQSDKSRVRFLFSLTALLIEYEDTLMKTKFKDFDSVMEELEKKIEEALIV